MTGHIGTNAPKFVPSRWGWPPFDPTETGLCKLGWVWSSQTPPKPSFVAPASAAASNPMVRDVIAQAFCSQKSFQEITLNYAELPWSTPNRNNRKGGTASLHLHTCVKRNAAFGARFKGLSLYFLYQNGNLIRIKTGLDTYLIRIQTRTPLWRYPPYDYSNQSMLNYAKLR